MPAVIDPICGMRIEADDAAAIAERDGQTYEVPFFQVGSDELWGATAMIVAELLAMLGAPVIPRNAHDS